MSHRSIGRLLHRDERGAALAIVMFVGVVIVVLSSIMVARGFRQLVNTNNDTNWDNALYASEAGLDQALKVLDYNFGYTTGDVVPDAALGTDAERAWAVQAADGAASTVTVPGGEYVVVRPSNSTVVYSVGYSPSRDAVDRRVRVIRASVDGIPYTFVLEHALLVGGNLSISGNSEILDTNGFDAADVHANGTISSTGSYSVEGCVTSSSTTFAATSGCPPSPAPKEPLPVVDPLLMYPYTDYLLCPDQKAYGGPASATAPDPDLIPCNGNETQVALVGWSAKSQGGKVTWSTSPSAATDGVFYVQNGNFSGKLGSNTWQMHGAIITANGLGATCLSPATGNIELSANSNVTVHPRLAAAGYNLLFVAQGDVAFGGGATVGGAIIAHEQIDYRGNAGSWGAVVAVDKCDTPGSPVTSSKTTSLSTLTGNASIGFPGEFRTPFTSSSLRADVVGWFEL